MATASTIASAALLMILVFSGFALARTLVVQFLGSGLGVAVLLDATLIPAFVLLPRAPCGCCATRCRG